MYLGGPTQLQTESGVYRNLDRPLQRQGHHINNYSSADTLSKERQVISFVACQLKERIGLLK